jgi:uracil-DNA glycosylase
MEEFLALLQARTPRDVFNPWTQRDAGTDLHRDAAARRQARLRAHVAGDIRVLLLGEAPGYQGCHVSGIPFTSERLILAGAIPRLPAEGRLSTRERPWSEPSATTVWGTLHELGIAGEVMLWNAYPWHPHRPGELQSNRTPTREEREQGLPVLRALLAALGPELRIFAVGRTAEASLADAGVASEALRHPSMGGAAQFRAQLRAALGR